MLDLGASAFSVMSQGFYIGFFFLFADDTNILGPRVKGTGIVARTLVFKS